MYDLDALDVQMKIKNRLIAKFWKELTAEYGKDKFAVGYADGTYTLTNGRRRFYLRPDADVEVIGNRWDNPELLPEVLT